MAARRTSRTGLDEPRPEKVAVVDRGARAPVVVERRPAHRVPRASRSPSWPACGGRCGTRAASTRSTRTPSCASPCGDLGLDDLEDLLDGPTAIAFVDGDAAAVAKALRDFARTNPNLVVKGGVLGTKVLTPPRPRPWPTSPPREVLLAQLAGALAAPLVADRRPAPGPAPQLRLRPEGPASTSGSPPRRPPAAAAEAPAADEPERRRRARRGRRRGRRGTDRRGRPLPPRPPRPAAASPTPTAAAPRPRRADAEAEPTRPPPEAAAETEPTRRPVRGTAPPDRTTAPTTANPTTAAPPRRRADGHQGRDPRRDRRA